MGISLYITKRRFEHDILLKGRMGDCRGCSYCTAEGKARERLLPTHGIVKVRLASAGFEQKLMILFVDIALRTGFGGLGMMDFLRLGGMALLIVLFQLQTEAEVGLKYGCRHVNI